MINKQDEDCYDLVCDHCETEHEDGPFDSFEEANRVRKTDGWLTGKSKKSKEWFNLCTECRAEPDTRKEWFDK